MTVSTTGSAGARGPHRPADGVTVTIDGFEITVPKGTLVIRAAEQLGIQIPRFCEHPLLTRSGPAGSAWCRSRASPSRPRRAPRSAPTAWSCTPS